VDVLFANAGKGAMVSFEQADMGSWEQVMSLPVKGTCCTVQNCLPMMRAESSIVLCSSISAARYLPRARRRLTRRGSRAGELVEDGIPRQRGRAGRVDAPTMTPTPGVRARRRARRSSRRPRARGSGRYCGADRRHRAVSGFG